MNPMLHLRPANSFTHCAAKFSHIQLPPCSSTTMIPLADVPRWNEMKWLIVTSKLRHRSVLTLRVLARATFSTCVRSSCMNYCAIKLCFIENVKETLVSDVKDRDAIVSALIFRSLTSLTRETGCKFNIDTTANGGSFTRPVEAKQLP